MKIDPKVCCAIVNMSVLELRCRVKFRSAKISVRLFVADH